MAAGSAMPDEAPWWDRGPSAGGTFILSIFMLLLAFLTFGLAFSRIISKSLWQLGIVWLIGAVFFFVLALARQRRKRSR